MHKESFGAVSCHPVFMNILLPHVWQQKAIQPSAWTANLVCLSASVPRPERPLEAPFVCLSMAGRSNRCFLVGNGFFIDSSGQSSIY